MTVDWDRILPPAVAGGVALFYVARSSAAAAGTKPARAPSAGAGLTATLPLLACLAGAYVAWREFDRPWLAVALVIAGYGVTQYVRAIVAERRERRDEAQWLVVIETTNRALRAGLPLLDALRAAAAEAKGAPRAIVSEILQAERIGDDLSAAVVRCMAKVQRPEFRAFGMAIALNQDVGGNLVATSARLSRTLLERSRVRRRARAIVSYSRAASTALVLLPLVAVTLLSQALDGYATFLFESAGGNFMIAIAAALLILGLRAIQKMARLEADSAAPGGAQ